MKAYPSEKIRNIALVGHVGTGKTTLAEALLALSSSTSRPGRVEDGSTVCDFDPLEVRRRMSISLALAPLEFEGYKINLIDTPGYADFIYDVIAALRVADLAIFVVSAVDGVEVGTEIIWEMAERLGTPRAVFINKLDRERASFTTTLDELKEKLGAGIAPLEIPIGEEGNFRGVIDLLDDHATTYAHGAIRGFEEPIPPEMALEEHAIHDALVEGIVVGDDDLMERYLNDEHIETKELATALANGIASASVFPVLCGSATKLIGIDRLASFIVAEGSPPALHDGPPVAFVFKTLIDAYIGRVALFKVLQGTVSANAVLTNGRTLTDERFHQLAIVRGKELDSVTEIAAGDIGAATKLNDTRVGDVLGERGADVGVGIGIEPLEVPSPMLSIAIRPKSSHDEEKLTSALHKLCFEDPSIRSVREIETGQTLLVGLGETHLNIATERLSAKYGVEVSIEEIKIPYRETVTQCAVAEGRYKKQTGGHGQFGVASVRVEPNDRGAGFTFIDAIVGGAIPRQFVPAVEKGIAEAMARGGVFGYPVVDLYVTCFDGKYHSVDSSEMSFKMAGSLALREAMTKAGPLLLEPVSEVVIICPERHLGDIMSDLRVRRGRIHGSLARGDGTVEITAFVPRSELIRYAIDLRAITGGRARFTADHAHYDPVPFAQLEKLTALPTPQVPVRA